MQARTVTLPYDAHTEIALTRVSLLRAGVPARVLDRDFPTATRPAAEA